MLNTHTCYWIQSAMWKQSLAQTRFHIPGRGLCWALVYMLLPRLLCLSKNIKDGSVRDSQRYISEPKLCQKHWSRTSTAWRWDSVICNFTREKQSVIINVWIHLKFNIMFFFLLPIISFSFFAPLAETCGVLNAMWRVGIFGLVKAT